MIPFRVRLRQRSYLESALYVIIAGALAALLLHRLEQLSEVAEKTAMEATVSRLQSALYVRAAKAVLSGGRAEVERDWAERNPVLLAHADLPNYLGGFDHPDLSTLEPGNWLYDRGRHELVYLVRRAQDFTGGTDPVPAIRFRLQVERTPSGAYSPYLLHAVTPFQWGPDEG
ncbi:MAG TPA: hypothetical protein VLX30_10300 [Burkholderiales bacterium]|nr:hypothetical protein [Burkholderiales bacterium]